MVVGGGCRGRSGRFIPVEQARQVNALRHRSIRGCWGSMEAAKQRGVRFGRPRKLNPDQTQVASQLLSEGKAVRDIARTFNVHEATIYRLAAAS